MGGYGPSKAATRSLSGCVRAELAGQGTQVTALIVGSVDTRMAAHVEGGKEKPDDIARAGLRAVTRGIDELDKIAWPSKCGRRWHSTRKASSDAWRAC